MQFLNHNHYKGLQVTKEATSNKIKMQFTFDEGMGFTHRSTSDDNKYLV